MIIEAREDMVMLEGSLEKNLWPTIQAAAHLQLRQQTLGIIVDCCGLTNCTAEGAKTFRDAMDYIERYHARIVVSRIPENVMETLRSVPGVRSRLPISNTVEEARASFRLARTAITRPGSPGRRQLQDILVPLMSHDRPDISVELACRLGSADHQKARIHLSYILEVPRQLPINSPLPDEESAAVQTLSAAEKSVRRRGLEPVTHVARTRDASDEIVSQARSVTASMIVFTFGKLDDDQDNFMERVVQPVLDLAPCEVIVNRLSKLATTAI